MSTARSLVARRLFTTLALVVAATSLSACSIVTGPDGRWGREQRDLSAARRTWSSQAIDDYEFVVRRNCYCPMGGVEVRIVVRNYSVVSREIDLSGVPVPVSMAYLYPTIDGLFSVVQDAIDERAYEISASYDRSYGFPTDIWIDYERDLVDEEEGYTLVAFRELR